RVCTDIGRVLQGSNRQYTVVVRSTVLPGTTEQLLAPALRAAGGNGISVAVNPEFMREGTALKDFAEPPLTLVGCSDPVTTRVLRRLYAKVDAAFVQTDIRTAEMAKYVSNAYHAVKVCFANEVGNVCHALGADAQEVMRVFRMDHKLNVSEAYLKPGFAFGGSCLPKDVRALLYAARTSDVSVPVLGSVLASNERQVQQGIDRVLAAGRRKVGVVGLAFKPDTDDLRESPMVTLVEALIGKGCDIRILDPNVSVARLTGANRRHIEEEIPHIASLMCDDEQALLNHAEVLVVTNSSDDAVRVVAAADPECTVVDLTQGALSARLTDIKEDQPAWRFVPSAAAAIAALAQPAR
ncbi:MAG: nucleotide sugar dehydrogenase, partial [Xanthomonadaceae bacterium]|nr:nucleotide sugar dehydrogenase [Xanthomonadaceae bacterium]